MRIVVKVHSSVRPAFSEWYRSLGPTDPARRELFEVLWEAFVARLNEFGGVPPEAERVDTPTGPAFVVEVGGRALFEYQLRDDSPRSGWRKLIRLITRRPRTL